MEFIDKVVILLIILLSFLLIEYYFYKNKNENNFIENFENSKSLKIKKTNNYKKIYSNDNYSIYEPIPIDDYLPTGQYITFNGRQPINPAILIKSSDTNKEKPVDYVITASTEDNMIVWKATTNKNYVSMGSIFSKTKPSVHRFLCVKKKYCKLTSLNNNIFSKNINDDNTNNKGYTIWDIRNNPHFVCSSFNNVNVPKNPVYEIMNNYITVDKPLKVVKTKNYKLVWEYHNINTSKDIKVWVPKKSQDYYPIGYLAFGSKINPNNNIETTLVHKDFLKKPIDYGNKSIVNYNMSDTNDSNIKNQNISFWKPRAPEGYSCLSDILIENYDEPKKNNLIYCLPTEYLKKNEFLKEIWNTVPDVNNKLAIFSDSNNYMHVNHEYKIPNIYPLEIDDRFIHVEKDLLDIKRGIVFVYEENKNTSDILDNETKENIIIENLANKVGVPISRFSDFKIDNNTISFSIEPKPLNSDQLSTYKIKNILKKLIESNSMIITNRNNKNNILKLNKIRVLEPEKNDYINIDNKTFADKFD